MNVTIRTETVEDATILHVAGEIDAFTAPKLQDTLIPLVAASAGGAVVLDLADVGYMDSTGIGVIVGALKATRQSGCRLSIRNANGRIQRLFRITGLNEIVPIMPGPEEEA